MLATAPASVPDLLARRRPGHSLEAPFYLSPEIFDLDMEVVFHRHWIFVAVEPDVPEPGDYMKVEIGKSSILIVRDDDNDIRAFHNVCRHRGARLVHEDKGVLGNIVCRYHMWTYNLQGDLLFADHMGADLDKSCRGLKPVHIRSLEGLLFVCLADEPPADFDDMAAEIGPYVRPHRLRDLKIVKQDNLIERGNWKLTMENNRECYHCAGNHPELTLSLFEYGYGFAPDALDAEAQEKAEAYETLVASSHAEWEGMGLPSREVDHLEDRPTAFRAERLTLNTAGESQTLNTKAACRRPVGDFSSSRLGGLSVWTQPNSWHHFMGDHVITFSVLPIDAEKTLLRTTWLVNKDAIEGVDYDVENVTGVWVATNRQDGELVGITQQGVRSPAYEPGPYSEYTEGLVEKFVNWYVGRMAAHLC